MSVHRLWSSNVPSIAGTLTLEQLDRILSLVPKVEFNRAVVAPDVWERLKGLVSIPGTTNPYVGMPLQCDGTLLPGAWQLWFDDVLFKSGTWTS